MVSDIERAGAVRICAVAASTPGFMVEYGWKHIDGASESAWDVAFAAWLESFGCDGDARWAAAESLLRSGWSS